MSKAEPLRGGLSCPSCGTRFSVAQDASVGDRVRCPKCQTKIRLGLEVLIGREVAGWRIEKRIGRGAMGAVFRAQHPQQGTAAIKFLDPKQLNDQEMSARFEREVALCLRLKHPHLAQAYEAHTYQGIPFLIMELVEGVALDRIIDRSGAMDWRKATEVLLQMTQVLAYFQEQEVIHRDIKPENILIDSQRRVKLIDLGFAKQRGIVEKAASDSSQLTMEGTALGSPAYMAPEQILDAMSATHATDCYCLGATYYHLITGRLPFDGKSAMEVMQRVLNERAVPSQHYRSDIPESVHRLLSWMMEKDLADRPQQMEQLSQTVEQILKDPNDCRGLPRQPVAVGFFSVPLAILIPAALLVAVLIGGLLLWYF